MKTLKVMMMFGTLAATSFGAVNAQQLKPVSNQVTTKKAVVCRADKGKPVKSNADGRTYCEHQVTQHHAKRK